MGADIQFRIWNPVMSVVSVQDLNASTRMTAQNALTHSLAKKTAREIQTERVKLEEYLGVSPQDFCCCMFIVSANVVTFSVISVFLLQVDINEMTRPWGLEVDRVELTFGSLGKALEDVEAAPPVYPSAPGLEGLAGPIQQLAMQFLSPSCPSQPTRGKAKHQLSVFTNRVFRAITFSVNCAFCAADSLTFTDERHSGSESAVATPGSVEELLSGVQRLLSESLVRHVGASFQFEISSVNGEQHRYYLDLSQGD